MKRLLNSLLRHLLNVSFETFIRRFFDPNLYRFLDVSEKCLLNILPRHLLNVSLKYFLNVCLLSLFTQDFKRFNETSFKHLAKIFIKCFIWDIYYMCKASSTIHMYYTCIWRQLLDVCWWILCPDKVKNCSWDITFCVALYTVLVI